MANLVRYKIYSFINFTRLAIGLAVCMLIILYISHENSFEKFYTTANNIFYFKARIRIDHDYLYMTKITHSTALLLKENEPSVETFSAYVAGEQASVLSIGIYLRSLQKNSSISLILIFQFLFFQVLNGNEE